MLSNTTNVDEILGEETADLLHNSTRYQDEACLETMRMIIKDYVANHQKLATDLDTQKAYKNSYEELRQNINDEGLKAYTAFEVMEKLYWQEYLIKK